MENIFYIILYILSICRHGHFFENDRFNYLQTKIKDTTNILKPSIPQKDVEIKLDFYNKTTTNLINFENSHIFQLSNKTHFLLDSHVYTWTSFNGSEMNKTYSLPYVEDEIILIKASEEFEENHFILTSFKNGVSHIYLLRNNQNPIHIQSLKNEEKLNDVKFFTNKNSLFLVTVNTGIKIYKYLGKYFDEIETIATKSSKISTFTHQDFEILVFLDVSNKETSITLYKFNGNLKKLQFISTPNLFDFEIYQNQPMFNTYMIVFAGKENYIYIWDYLNFEFINLFEFGSINNAKKAVIVEEEVPLIFLITNLGIESFQFSSNNIQRLESFKFEEDAEEILKVVVENNGIEILLNNKMNELKIINVNYFVYINQMVSSTYNEDPVEDCLSKLENKLEEELNQFSNRKKRFHAPTDVEIEPGYDFFDLKSTKLNKTANEVQDLINEVTLKIIGFKNEMINKTLVIDNDLESSSLKTKDINLKIINNIKWTPDNWLSYSKQQIITAPIETNNLKAKHVEVKSVKNLILKNESISINKPFKINNLKCERVLAKTLNGNPLKNIYLKNSNVVINGSKSFNEVEINNLESPNINYPDCFKNININQIEFEPNSTVNNLNIKTINGINWDEFKNKSKNQELNKKSLSVPSIIINKLRTESINGLKIDDLLTKGTDQIIKSKFVLNKSQINNLKVQKVNGLDFNKDIVINSNRTKKFNRIKILGNLRLKSINLSDIFIQGKRFDFNVSNDYWMVNTNQTIPGNLIIKNTFVNNLRTKTINNTPFNEYISIDKECNFKNLHVKGNLKLNFEKEHSPNWVDLSENIVRNGGGYKLRGQKNFNGTITVMNANIDYLNNVKVDDVPTIHNNDFDDYTFDTIIANQLFFKKTTVEKLNNKSINEITNNIQFNDQKLNFKKLSLGNVLIHDLKIDENLNDHNFSKYLDDINGVYNIKEINNVEATKNINAKFAKITKSINGVNVELIEEAVRKGAIMSGNITFKNQVFIKNLFIENLNEINLPETLNKLLKKNQNQIISGKYSFNIIRANDLTSNLINNYNLENLIDTNKKTQQVLKGNFKFKSINVKSLKGELICNLKDVINFFKTPPMKIWNSVTIKGNITGINNVFQHIIDNVVRLDQNNIITKPVKFVSNVHTNNIKSKRGLNGIYLDEIHKDALLKKGDDQLINGFKTFKILTCSSAEIDGNADIPIVNAIIIKNINDSLITKDIVNKIKIKGHKVFNSGLNVKKLNTTNISGLNTSHLVNLDDLKSIPKAKFATSDIVGNLSLFHVNNTVDFNKFLLNRFKKDGVNQELSGVYYFDAIETKKSINLVKLNNVIVNDIVEIDKDINLTSKNFEGNLTIQGNVTLNFINDADVLKKYNLSVFYGKPAKFLNDLVLGNVTELNGNVKTNKINGVDIKNVNQFLNSNEIYFKTKQNEEIVKEIQNVVQNHKINIKNMPQDYMYLEKVDELQINIPNTISAEIIDKPDGVLINMIDDSPGNNCGLPKEGCNCQSQHVLKITNNYSLQTISHESSDRIFSYQTDSISAHLITNTISYSRLCTKNLNRNNSESTILTWTDLKGLKTYTKFNLTEGFITGAKYFEYMGEVYVVLTRFYEQSATTHNLDCVIYKFGHSNGLVELVQKIPTKGAWTLYLFNSPQGLILIIGNIFDSTSIFSGTSTDIFIFNEHVKQFELLRNFVGSGAISVTDIVLNGETQIILAQRDSPLVILKYNVDYNNFYIYQNIHQESEIISVSRFYLGGERTKDAYLNVVTETNQFFVYVYKHVEGWIIESQGEIDGLRSLVPFNLNGNIYLLAPSTKLSSLLTVKKYG